MPKLKKKKSSSANAAGAALGYGLQYTRLTYKILTPPMSAVCGFEYLDDVSEEGENKTTYSQTKSALTSNPVADRALSLWKTFHNWVKYAYTEENCSEQKDFEIYVSRPVTGEIVKSFHEAKTNVEAIEALKKARLKLWGEKPKFEKKKELSPELLKYIEHLFESDQEKMVSTVCNFSLVCGSGSPTDDLEELIKTHSISPSKVKMVTDHIVGVIKNKVDRLLEQERPAVINKEEIHAAYRAFRRKIDSETLLSSYARPATRSEIQENMPRTFVKQLDLVKIDYDEKLKAVNSWLMASADRASWAKYGDVDPSSFDELDDKLKQRWKNHSAKISLKYPQLNLEQKGELLYRECIDQDELVEAKHTPNHFIPGCLHSLSDELDIGWHPHFESILKK